ATALASPTRLAATASAARRTVKTAGGASRPLAVEGNPDSWRVETRGLLTRLARRSSTAAERIWLGASGNLASVTPSRGPGPSDVAAGRAPSNAAIGPRPYLLHCRVMSVGKS